MNYYRQLDGLRAVAIFLVMGAHWLLPHLEVEFLKNIPYSSGVTLFFVISGFLITKILLDFKEKNKEAGISQFNSIKSFYIRRSLRIFPIYYLTIFFLYFINFSAVKELFPWLVSYTTNIYMAVNSKYIGSFTHFWSLAVEEQFYLFWVFVVVFVPKHYLKGIITTFIVISLLTLFYLMLFTSYWLSDLLVISQMHALGFGALIAYYMKYEPEFLEKMSLTRMKGYITAIVIVYILIFIAWNPDSISESLKIFKNPLTSVAYFFVVMIAVKDGFRGIVKMILESRVMVFLGKISYGLYVYHLFMHPFFHKFLNNYIGLKTSEIGYMMVYFVLDVIIATISWYALEKPILGLKRYFKY